MKDLVSTCHDAKLGTESSDEGSGFHWCTECGQPCDFYNKFPEMRIPTEEDLQKITKGIDKINEGYKAITGKYPYVS